MPYENTAVLAGCAAGPPSTNRPVGSMKTVICTSGISRGIFGGIFHSMMPFRRSSTSACASGWLETTTLAVRFDRTFHLRPSPAPCPTARIRKQLWHVLARIGEHLFSPLRPAHFLFSILSCGTLIVKRPTPERTVHFHGTVNIWDEWSLLLLFWTDLSKCAFISVGSGLTINMIEGFQRPCVLIHA